MTKRNLSRHKETRDLLRKIVKEYNLEKLKDVIENDDSVLFEQYS